MGFALQMKILHKFIVLDDYTKGNVNVLQYYRALTFVTDF